MDTDQLNKDCSDSIHNFNLFQFIRVCKQGDKDTVVIH